MPVDATYSELKKSTVEVEDPKIEIFPAGLKKRHRGGRKRRRSRARRKRHRNILFPKFQSSSSSDLYGALQKTSRVKALPPARSEEGEAVALFDDLDDVQDDINLREPFEDDDGGDIYLSLFEQLPYSSRRKYMNPI